MIPENLRVSITNLWDEFGRADSPIVGFGLNTLLALVGVSVYLAFTGWVSYVGGVWAILHVLSIIKWVFKL